VKTLLMARLRVMDFKKNSAQKGALQKYEEFMSYARRTSPNSYNPIDKSNYRIENSQYPESFLEELFLCHMYKY
jgi:hypothetical protein